MGCVRLQLYNERYKNLNILSKSGRLRSALELKTLGLSGMDAIENKLHGHLARSAPHSHSKDERGCDAILEGRLVNCATTFQFLKYTNKPEAGYFPCVFRHQRHC